MMKYVLSLTCIVGAVILCALPDAGDGNFFIAFVLIIVGALAALVGE